ncbi:hypothetical protein G647_08446 [Cladophialophora carrionii CBS 160.54]|uniref:Uncharacterized protein n=1 Tax=Cladophialophora carrionii CBS 160.54 TaxID=1279043 RepID=V9D1B9_9EURO|nr:uncharacterized protein G647_08446 [Cladophialophora carrionii CBS 160.54]ETI20411.1 hypothetical protein G647_08446 [Cladophialophora carrionii CBS 160.54]
MKPQPFFPSRLLFRYLALLFVVALLSTPVLIPIPIPARVHALPIQDSLTLDAIDASVIESLALAYTAYLEKKQQGTTQLLDTIDDFVESAKSALDTDFELTRAMLVEVVDLLRRSNDAQSESNQVARRNADVQKRSLAIQERTLQLAEQSNRGAVEQIITA